MSSAVAPLSASATATQRRALSLYAAFVVGFMVLVILEGAFVRATGAGAGCGNHWPLCNGDFFPHHPRLATVIEYTHRSMTGLCTTLVAVLIGWTFLARPRGHRGRRAVVWSGVLLLTEALLGADLYWIALVAACATVLAPGTNAPASIRATDAAHATDAA